MKRKFNKKIANFSYYVPENVTLHLTPENINFTLLPDVKQVVAGLRDLTGLPGKVVDDVTGLGKSAIEQVTDILRKPVIIVAVCVGVALIILLSWCV